MPETISPVARAHLTWALTDGVGPVRFARILERFGDARQALGARASELREIERIGATLAEQIAHSRDAADVEAEIQAATDHGVRILSQADADYPPGLRRMPDPPIVLFVKGELRATDAIALAVVGSRRCSIYGSEQSRRFGELLAGAGVTVVSGLARGIDAFAQHGAVDAGGRSIAVLGSGLDQVYPPENRTLAERLLLNGAWVSELPIATAVRAENFPARNRIIAGLSLGVLVVEAAHRSGALITAKYAREYNREVFAIPGRVQDPTSFGTNALIRDGAKLVSSLEDILSELGEVGQALARGAESPSRECIMPSGSADASPPGEPAGAEGLRPSERAEASPGSDEHARMGSGEKAGARAAAGLSAVEQAVYQLIGYDPVLQDFVLRASELPPGSVLAAFTALELKGLVRRLPGQLIVRQGHA
jgi:DNA processing protein